MKNLGRRSLGALALAVLLGALAQSNAAASQTIFNENRGGTPPVDWTLPVGTNLLAGATFAPATVVVHEASSNTWATLTNGVVGAYNDKTVSVTPNNGDTVTFTLNTSVNTAGYSITSIDTYCSWNDSGRDNQNYTIFYATVLDPATFIQLSIVNNASTGVTSHTNITDTSGIVATNVGAIRFSFGITNGGVPNGQENGYVGYREFIVLGTAVPTNPPLTWTGASGSGGNATWVTTADSNWKKTSDNTAANYADGVITNFDSTGANTNITVQGGGVAPTSLVFSNASGTNYTFGGGTITTIGVPGTLTLSGTGAATFNNSLNLGGAINMTNGTLSLNVGNTIAGATNVGSGTLNLNNNVALGNSALVVNGGTVNFLTAAPSLTSLAGNGGTLVLGNSTGPVNTTFTMNNTAAASYSGAISQVAGTTSGLTKTGTGVLSLGGASTYTGPTTISAGTVQMLVTGSLAVSSSVAVNANATLGGSGAANGAVSVVASGHLAPGVNTLGNFGAIGTLTLGSAVLNANSNVDLDLGSASTSDRVAVTGQLTLPSSGNVIINFNTAGALIADGTYKIFTFGTLFSAFNPSQLKLGTTPVGGGTYTFVLNGNGIDLIVSGASVAGGLFSSAYLGAGNFDTAIGLSSTKTYLNAINTGSGAAVTINGITFGANASGNPTGAGALGTNWQVTGSPNVITTGNNFVTGSLGALVNDFIYGGNSTLTVTGLTPGQAYIVTYYNRSFDAAGLRVMNLSASDGGTGVFDEDLNAAAQGEGNLLRYSFVANGTAETVTLAAQVAANTMHVYGFSTEQVFNKTWVSGNVASTAVFNPAGAPNGQGSNVAFPAQGTPTSFNLDVSVTLGHVSIDGANAWTFTGSPTTLLADLGGVSILEVLTGSHTISAPLVLSSDAVKLGGGTLTLSGGVSGTRGLFVNAGTLLLQSSNTYTGATKVNGGVLKLGNAAALGSGGTGTSAVTVNTNAILDLNGQSLAAAVPLNLSGAGQSGAGAVTNSSATAALYPGDITSSAGAFTVGGTGDITLSGAIAAGTAVTLTKIGSNTLTISGITDNTNLSIVINGGAVVLSKTSTASVHALGAAGVIINSGGILKFGGSGGDQIPDASSLTINAGGTLDLNALGEGINGLFGVGTVTNNLAGTGTLNVGAGGGDGLFTGTIQNGAANAGIVALTKSGAGAQVIAGTGTYTGATTITAGTLRLSVPSTPLAGLVPNFSFETPGLGTGFAYDPPLGVWTFTPGGRSGISANGSGFGSVVVAPNGTQCGLLQSNGGISGIISQSLNFPASGVYSISFGTEARNGQSGANTFKVTIDGNTILGLGAVVPVSNSSFNTVSGPFTLASGGAHTLAFTATPPDGLDRTSFIDTIVISGAAPGGTCPALSPASALVIGSGGTLDLNSYDAAVSSLADLAGSGGSITNSSPSTPATLTVNLASGSSTFSGIISNTPNAAVSIVKSGAGTLLLTGNNTYNGLTTVSAGTLRGTGSPNALTTITANLFPGTAAAVTGAASYPDIGTQVFSGASIDFGAASKLQVVITSSGAAAHSTNVSVGGGATVAAGAKLDFGISSLNAMPATDIPILTSVTASIVNTFALAKDLPAGWAVIYKNGANEFNAGRLAGPSQVITGLASPANVVVIRTNGSVSPVTVDAFAAKASGLGVLLEWDCVSEFQNAGFNVYRRAVESDSWTRVNPALINGRITNPDAKRYALYDWAPAGEFLYKLESIDVAGRSETYSELAGPVALAWNAAPVAAESIDAMLSGLVIEAGVKNAERVGEAFAATDAREPRSSTLLLAAARAADSVSTVKSIPNAPQHGAEYRSVAPGESLTSAPAHLITSSSAGVRWLSAASSNSTAAAYTGAKIQYSATGVMFVPQSSLPAGFDVNHVSIQREARSVGALAVVPGGLLLYAPGYQDDYTDKDAFFLRRIAGATQAGNVPNASNLFTSTLPVNTASPAHAGVQFHDVYFDYNYRPFNFTPWFSAQYLTGGTTQSFTLNTPAASGGAAVLTIDLWSLTSSDAANPDHALQVVFNGQPVASTLNWDGGERAMQLTVNIPGGVLLNGANQIDLVTPSINGVDSQIAFLHALSIDYTRTLDGANSFELSNTANTPQLFELFNVPSANAWVVDTRFAGREALVAAQTQTDANGTYRLRFIANAGGKYLFVPSGQENAPLSVSLRQVRPVRLNGTYLATGPIQFSSGVQPLLMAHTREGIKSQFVDQEQLFDFYNFGRFGPAGIQKAVRATKPQYLLLLGRTTYDYKNYSGANVDPLCPTFLVATSFWAQSTSDSKFGDLGRSYPEAAIGRLPANNASELGAMVSRILAYKGAPVSGVRGHLVADMVDPAVGDFGQQLAVLAQSHADISWQTNTLGVTYQTSPEVNAAMTTAANGGADLIIYNGHGNSTRLGKNSPRILDVDLVQNWSGNVIFLQSTCTANWMAKDETGFKSIAIQAMTQPQGGICASIGTSTYMNPDAAMAFMHQLLRNAGPGGARWGKALMQAQQWALGQNGGVSGSASFYSDIGNTEQIFGDPAMNVYAPPERNRGGAATAPGGNAPVQAGTF